MACIASSTVRRVRVVRWRAAVSNTRCFSLCSTIAAFRFDGPQDGIGVTKDALQALDPPPPDNRNPTGRLLFHRLNLVDKARQLLGDVLPLPLEKGKLVYVGTERIGAMPENG